MTHHGRRLFLKAILAGVAGARVLRSAPQPATARLQFLPGGGASLLWVVTERGSGTVSWRYGAHDWTPVTMVVRPLPPEITGLEAELDLLVARLPDLPPETDIEYALEWNGAPAGEGAFRTPGPHGPTATFLALGDSGTQMPEQYAIAAAMNAETDADFVLHVGDMGYPAGSFIDLRDAYLKPYAAQMARIPFYSCPGNHEYYTDVLRPYMKLRVGPDDEWSYYSVQHGPVHVIAVDSNDPVMPDPELNRMLQWLERQLAESTSFWRVVIFHHVPYTAGLHKDDEFVDLARRRLAPLVERYAVPLVVNGHEHFYQRTCPVKDGLPAPDGAGTTYIVTGGGGAPLYPFRVHPLTAFGDSVFEYVKVHIDGLRMVVTALDRNRVEFDRVAIAPLPAIRDVVNAADLRPALAPGSLAVLRGFHFPPDRPVRLRCGGELVDVIDSGAVTTEFQIPYQAGPILRVQVDTPNGAVESEVRIVPLAPALFPADRRSPAVPGSYSAVLATGLGTLTGEVPEAPLTLSLSATLVPASAVPTALPGVFRIEFQVPADVPEPVMEIRLGAAAEWSAPIVVPVAVPFARPAPPNPEQSA
ncbi:metallophosphoesterase [uncultured Paludibaculum sp.]|uniref:metallophosphoesterase n=1 Tax=uncultured Paludibaculum sp. TaxID=1765020 RepID=UPI002AAB47B1|nr:metallophosphoesterase [uncultured Paludibaculum sp.]